MEKEKKARLEAHGWKVGTVEEFLGLTPEEVRIQEAAEGMGTPGSQRSFWELYQAFRRSYGDLDVETSDAFADARDPAPGRDFSW
jgi:hypothetical protein